MASKILYVCQEITPYLPETENSRLCRALTQAMQERGNEIRTFMPRYGCINERRHQLHEVIRLSGMNLIIDDNDHQLIIKVASIPAARVQIYFIDNDDYFSRKAVLTDAEGNYFADNDERSIFFARGVLETVKKLRWTPSIVHCHGWFSSVVPVYLKHVFADDPIFRDVKIVVSLYGDGFPGSLWSMPTAWLRHPRRWIPGCWRSSVKAGNRCSNTSRPTRRTFSIITTDSMKRFNNIRRLLLSAATLAVVGTSMLPGCTSVDDTLGSNLVPDNQQMYAGYVTIPRIDELNPKQYVETRLYQTDSIISTTRSDDARPGSSRR